jgi:hypothetical protein
MLAPLSSKICFWKFNLSNDLQKKRGAFTRSGMFAQAVPFHLQRRVFGSREYLYGDYPNEAGPKATRSEIGVISRLALSEQSIL